MKQVIFSIHIDLEEEKLDKQLGPYWAWEPEDRSTKTKRVMNEYSERLIENKQVYADLQGCDYFHYTNGNDYKQFRDLMYSYCTEQNEYHVVNFYKLWKMERLAEKYDEVLYVDFDVLFETKENFFDVHNLDSGIHVHLEDYHEEAFKKMFKKMYDKEESQPKSDSLSFEKLLSNDLNQEELFKLKILIFENEAIKESKDRSLKTKIRKSKDVLEIINLYYNATQTSS